MERELRRLAEVMERLTQQFDELHAALLRERLQLKARQPEKVEAEAQAIEALLERLRAEENERKTLVDALGTALKLPPERRAAQDFDLALKGRSGLLAPRDRLKAAAERADYANRENQAILQGLNDAADLLIKTLVDASAVERGGYDRKGGRRGGAGMSLFSRQL
ncbi:MAG: flagellar export chaperone FlgN [Magnetococcales bacterium]|nr:flagellar export chaperone FlgN [Magnetococcales bacterium]